MMLWHNAQLRSQLLVSYLLIVAVASATFYVVSEALAPAFTRLAPHEHELTDSNFVK